MDRIPSKEELMAELVKQAEDQNSGSEFNPYTCGKCNMPVKFTYILGFIKKSGLCPSCYNE